MGVTAQLRMIDDDEGDRLMEGTVEEVEAVLNVDPGPGELMSIDYPVWEELTACLQRLPWRDKATGRGVAFLVDDECSMEGDMGYLVGLPRVEAILVTMNGVDPKALSDAIDARRQDRGDGVLEIEHVVTWFDRIREFLRVARSRKRHLHVYVS